jgi:hypothetical protein
MVDGSLGRWVQIYRKGERYKEGFSYRWGRRTLGDN